MHHARPGGTPRHVVAALVALMAGAGCDTAPTETAPDAAAPHRRLANTILDGAHGGNPQFFFLPPLVPEPSYTGTFDGTQSPTVTICELAGTACGPTIATYSGRSVTVHAGEQWYQVVWKTREHKLNPARLYRIEVAVGGNRLGYADVVVQGDRPKDVNPQEYAVIQNRTTVPIRFRIETAPPPPPPPPPPAGWQDGDVITFSQLAWGDPGFTSIVGVHFNRVYAATFAVLEVGLSGASGYSLSLTSGDAVMRYLPATGSDGPLTADLVDPYSTAAGAFGGDVVALALNIDFSDAGASGPMLAASGRDVAFVRIGRAATPFGDLVLCNLPSPSALNGQTIRQLRGHVNVLLGGGASLYTVAELSPLVAQVNAAFAHGTPTAFAHAHLGLAGCQPASWTAGDYRTLTQDQGGSAPAPQLLAASYDNLYFPVFGVVEVGVPGTAGYSLQFTGHAEIDDYLPSVGAPATLNADLADPGSSASGVFGGDVLALKLNIDFADAGHLVAASGKKFGDLRLCGLAGGVAGLNGTTIRDLAPVVNTALGGGAVPYAIADLWLLTESVNGAFNGGFVSAFARSHLVAGACP